MTWYSQAGQDEFVHSIVGDTGFFVDVGAHDGIVHSNTYALEQLGWTGLAVDPNHETCDIMRRDRTCLVACVAASDVAGSLYFDGVSVHGKRELEGWDVPAQTLATLLTEVDAPPVIDYLSIDVEGHELEVLAGMDFARWHVRLITIEHNLYCDGPDRKNAIYDILTGHGFERVREDVVAEGYGAYEDWFVNGD